jgi:hypothetical protein
MSRSARGVYARELNRATLTSITPIEWKLKELGPNGFTGSVVEAAQDQHRPQFRESIHREEHLA